MTELETKLFENSLSDLGQIGFVWRFAEGVITWQSNVRSVLGLEKEQIPDTASAFKLLINPQDLPNLMTALQDYAGRLQTDDKQEAVRVNEPFRLRVRDGSHKSVRMIGRMVLEKETGAALLSGLIAHSNDVMLDTDNDGKLLSGRLNIAKELEDILLGRSAAIQNRGYFMALGLDRVGLLNEAYGAPCVDSVLVEVEGRLTKFLDGKARVGRISGDVYGLIFDDLPHNQADTLAAGLLQMFTSTPVRTLYGPVMIGLSIGGVALVSVEEKGSDMIARAEAALREAKEKGRGCFVTSSPLCVQRETARKLLASGQAVHQAMEEGRMRMAFQPVMDMKSGKISFFECLIRMIDDQGRLAPADSFIPALEELGMMRLLDIFSLHTAIRELEEFPEISLSVNVSNLSLVDAGWLRNAVSLLSAKRKVASRLIVEITESSAMHDIDHVAKIVGTLKELGCRIALDDFGAGQTSFRQLKMLDVDIVKIDKSYIRDISDPMNQLFVKALLDLSIGMNLETVAEGAETIEETEMLKKGGISHVQGYAIGFPSIERVWLPKNHTLRTQNTAK